MPLFEFRCRECQQDFEILVRNQEQATCPNCHTSKLDKLMSASAGHMAGAQLPLAQGCPPPSAGPCSPHCCRIPQG